MDNNTRNFCIIAHIDHGKSTLADRFLELTSSVEKRKMKEQFLDTMELERERGITIKLQPVTMKYSLSGKNYILNLIDTPGHIDFSYEVSRSLEAVEGAILLVDASQGVQAQTITNVELARAQNLKIIPVLNKIDLPHSRVDEVKKELTSILDIPEEEVMLVSAKTGEGVSELLEVIVNKIPVIKKSELKTPRALIFDFAYSAHKGIIAYVRMFDGEVRKGDEVKLHFADKNFIVGEVGIFRPALEKKDKLSSGDIGYIVTNIKRPEIVKVGDTVISPKNPLPALPGYKEPKPVVFSSVYPESQDDFEDLRVAFSRLRLTDSAFSFEQESDSVLGRGFRCGFLGMLHLEIVIERIKREFALTMIVATPTVAYDITSKNGETTTIYSPSDFPEEHDIEKVLEPWIDFEILTPQKHLSGVLQLLQDHESKISATDIFGKNRLIVKGGMPLRELMRGFFDKLKSVSQGYASFNYEISTMKQANIARIDILVAEKVVSAFSRVVARHRVEYEARRMVEKLKDILPRMLFVVKIQAQAQGRILASRSLTALKKNVTGNLYGGDITRKMKLWKKQKKGKKRLQEHGKVNIPHDIFVKMIQE